MPTAAPAPKPSRGEKFSSKATSEVSKLALTHQRAQDARPRNNQRWPFAAGPSIGECLDAYHAEHSHRREATAYYVTETFNQFLACLDIEENWPVNMLDKGHCKTYKAMLLSGALAPTGRRKPGPVTISRKLGVLHHFVKWAVNNDHMEHDIMAGLALPPKAVANARVQKEGFSDVELTTIFSALAAYRVHREPVMREWYWAILLLAHSGCRLTEVLQLMRSDVQQEDGIWFFTVSGSTGSKPDAQGRMLKNKGGTRAVPIHSNVLKASFVEDYLNTKPHEGRLFPLLFPYGGVKTTMTFSRLLRKLKIKKPALTLHSFRHTMTVKLERARVHYSLMRRLLGHAVGKAVEDRVYLGSLKYSVKELSEEAVEAVRFP